MKVDFILNAMEKFKKRKDIRDGFRRSLWLLRGGTRAGTGRPGTAQATGRTRARPMGGCREWDPLDEDGI